MKTSKTFLLFTLALIAFAFGSVRSVEAADAQKADPSGTWKWSFQTQGGQTIEASVKLKAEGEKITGAFVGRSGVEVPVQDGKLKGDEVSFSVVRDVNGQKMVAKYTGRISGDSLKGKIETEREGQSRSFDWDAKRDNANASATGTWKWTFEVPNGPTFEPSVKLKQEGEKLSGTLTMGDTDRPISEGSLKGDQVAFKVLSKRDDRTVTSHYAGKLSGDTIKGKWDSDWSGEVVAREWDAKRTKD